MNAELAQDFILLVAYLLPGFLAAWIFYGLTSHPKPSQFERVVEALIFTFVVQTVVPLVHVASEFVGLWAPLGAWDSTAERLASLVLGVSLGAIGAYFTNADSFHRWLRSAGFTTRTSHPSEWYCVLAQKVTFVVLHMSDGRRLFGWPKEWPVECDRGQFYIMQPSWIDREGQSIELPQLDGILIHARDVRWVEFLACEEKSP